MSAIDHTVTVELPPIEPVTNGKPSPPRIYAIAGMGPGVRAEYVRILKQRAWQELDRQATSMPVSRYNRLESSLMQAMGAGKYEWEGEVFYSISGTEPGFKMELLARIRVGSDEILPDELADELVEKIGLDRLHAMFRQADGPESKNALTPAT